MKHLYSRLGLIGTLFIAIFFIFPNITFAALPSGFEINTVVSGLNLPTSVAFSNDGRIFIAEKGGAVKVVKNGSLLPTPLITLSDVNTYGDRGLLGIAIDPNFSTNGYMYLLYTYENTPGLNIAGSKTGRLVRITVTGDTSTESTKVVLVGTVGGNITNPSCDNYAIGTDCIPSDSLSHSVGGLRFGPDGKLYVSLGDGSSFDYADPRSLRAQNLDSLGGKILRINTDGTAPADNPFYNGSNTSNRSRIYAYGVRNAYRFNFRPTNGALFSGDVGWSTYEEVNRVVSGGNYGWPCREGAGVTPLGLNCTPNGTATDPLYFYAHDANGAGSVTGGTFPTGTAYPASFLNSYFFGDYAQNFIKRIDFDSNNAVVSVSNFATGVDGTDGPVEFVTGPEGNVYFLGIYTGTLKKIGYTLGNRQPLAVIGATPTSGFSPLTINFSSAGSSDPDGNPLTYLWNFGNNATSSLANPTYTYNVNGSYLATLTVFDGQGGINTKSINITVGNQSPQAVINSPVGGSLYTANSSVQLNGSGIDPETGALSGSALNWSIILHHNTHTHTIQTLTGNNPVFIAPDHSDPDVYIEVILTVTDPIGLTNTTSINMYLNNNTQTSGNQILNPSVETADPANPTIPQNWFKGGYGVNNAIYTYPVAGYDGQSASRLQVTGFVNGDAKWFFSPVYVTPGLEYKFSNYYTSNVLTGVTAQFGYPNGTYSYMYLGDAPIAGTWTKFERLFTVPAGAETVTIFHALNGNGILTTDNFVLALNSTSTVDNINPLVSVTSPVASTTVSGIINLTVSSTDNVAVAGVTFLVDGVATSTEDTTAPYSISLNTNLLTNGAHTVSARSRDTSNNQATSILVPFNVSNITATTTVGNLIINPGLETVSTTTAGMPYAWRNSKWGTNTTTFTYPTPGLIGNGVRVSMTAYTSGDAKWWHNDVNVTPGATYDLSVNYQSNATTTIGLRYTSSTGALSYPALSTAVAPSATWKKINYRFTVPANITKVTTFHLLKSVGFLTTDDYSISLVDTVAPQVSISSPINGATVSGVVNLIASSTDNNSVPAVKFLIDGVQSGNEILTNPYSISWNTSSTTNGAHTVYAVARDSSNNFATSTISVIVNNTVSTTTTNLIPNGSFEIANGQNPEGWTPAGWGSNTRIFTYPIIGSDGNKAVQFDVTNYVDGDIKWAFSPVPVSSGIVYEYKDKYKSSTISDLIGQYTFSDGSVSYFGLVKEIQPTNTWTQVVGTFSPPVGATSVTLYHLISANGYLTLDDVSMTAIGTTTPVTDTQAPIVAFVSPLDSSTVSGTVNLVASSTDNVAVTYVVFAVDGNIVSPNITTSPYTYSWNTTTVPNGSHILKATTHDAVGNNAFTTISVNVNNTSATSSSNLIANPGLEVTGANNDPLQWIRGGWGTNTSVFTYPVAGRTSAKAARVAITSYTNGDAKWLFTPVTITPGTQYNYSNYYTSTATTTVTVRYTKSDNSFIYTDLAVLPPASTWTQYSVVLTPPASTTQVTVYPKLVSVGTLTIDDYSLAPVSQGNPNAFNQGMVSLTFDDGWLSHYTDALPILNSANMKGSFGIVTLETLDALPTNRITNPSLETDFGNGTPTDWFKGGWGTNDAVHTYPVAGQDGNSAANITITNYTDGDAKWFFKDVTVIPNQEYLYSDYYISDVPTTISIRYNMGSSTYQYIYLADVPVANTWTQFQKKFTVPAGVNSITIFHHMNSLGSLTIDNVNVSRVQVFVDPSMVLQMQAQGHEIASHTRTHASLSTIPVQQMQDEIIISKSELTNMGVTTVNTLVYPYGDYSPLVQQTVQSAGYIGARSVDRGYNDKATDKFALKTQQMGNTVTFADAKAWIDSAYDNKTWLTLMFHQVDNSGQALAMTPQLFQQIVNYIASKNIPVVTLQQGISQMNP